MALMGGYASSPNNFPQDTPNVYGDNYCFWNAGYVWWTSNSWNLNTDYVIEYEWNPDTTKVYGKFRTASTMALLAGSDASQTYSYANDRWFYFGPTSNNAAWQGQGYGTWVYDYAQIFKSLNINITGLSSGYSAKIYDSSDAEKATATESGGTATLDVQLLEFPFTGYIKVFDGAEEKARYPGVGNATDIWGGDEYNI
jgi:hypothetical protein